MRRSFAGFPTEDTGVVCINSLSVMIDVTNQRVMPLAAAPFDRSEDGDARCNLPEGAPLGDQPAVEKGAV